MKSSKIKGSGYFSSNKPLVHKFSVLFWLISLFIITVVSVQTITIHNQKQEADRLYGKWTGAINDISQQELSRIYENPLFKEVSVQEGQGTVIQNRDGIDYEFGAIGTFSPDF